MACSASGSPVDDGPLVGTQEELIGGQRARAGEYGSSLLVAIEYPLPDGSTVTYPTCTAAKVGDRQILIAAHCMLNADVETGEVGLYPWYQPGATLRVTNDTHVRFAEAELLPVTVKEAHVYPSFLERCEEDPMCVHVGVADGAPDVGIIELEEPLEGVPSARIDLRPVLTGEPLAIQGYGCRDRVQSEETREEVELKWARTFAVPAEALSYRDVFRYELEPEEWRKQIGSTYVVTPGPIVAPDQAGLCPGDSGGPIYRRQGRNDLVVGVNASYSFIFDEETQSWVDIPLANWHTRLDVAADEPVAWWLISHGAKFTWSRTLPVYYEKQRCEEGFDAKPVGFFGRYCVDQETGLVDARNVTPDMALRCTEQKEEAGEDPSVCYADQWEPELYLSLRGNGYCPNGAHFDVRLGMCVNGFFADGPLSEEIVSACETLGFGADCSGPTPRTTEVHRATTTAAVKPVLECVREGENGLVASFGYLSEALRPIHIGPGVDNRFTGGADRDQTADFLPGRQRHAFEVPFGQAETLVWTLASPDGSTRTSTASASSQRCE